MWKSTLPTAIYGDYNHDKCSSEATKDGSRNGHVHKVDFPYRVDQPSPNGVVIFENKLVVKELHEVLHRKG